MAKTLALVAGLTLALTSSTGASPARRHTQLRLVKTIRVLSLELVGQFQNSAPGVTPATHVHYGYLSYLRGLSAFTAAPNNETTARFTFYADAATPRVIPNGPLRIVTRVGRLTIYRDPAPDGDFGRPSTFRDGTPVLVARFRQQVVTNTVTNSFTTFHTNTIIAARPFSTRSGDIQLGRVGATFKTYFNGQANMPGPPSGYFGGYAISG